MQQSCATKAYGFDVRTRIQRQSFQRVRRCRVQQSWLRKTKTFGL